jgi:hypothetical protein
MDKLSGIGCFQMGRLLSRLECGLAVAGRGILSGNAQEVAAGLQTVRNERVISRTFLGQNAAYRRMGASADAITKMLITKTVSKRKSSEILKRLQSMKADVDKLFQETAKACPGKGGKR